MKLIKRSWFRYSLRTFLVILTLFAVWLGWTVHCARQTRLAIDAIEELGGHVAYLHERTKSGEFDSRGTLPGPAWLRELIGNEYFLDVSRIEFFGPRITSITNDDLKQLSTHLKKLQNLQWLNLGGCPISDISALQGRVFLHQVRKLSHESP